LGSPRDVIATLIKGDSLPDNEFEYIMLKDHLDNVKSNIDQLPALDTTTTLVEVFIDDFITATNDQTIKHLIHVSRAMLHGVHSNFPLPAITNHPGEDQILEKKLANGDMTDTDIDVSLCSMLVLL
jgi:hypothetical protein